MINKKIKNETTVAEYNQLSSDYIKLSIENTILKEQLKDAHAKIAKLEQELVSIHNQVSMFDTMHKPLDPKYSMAWDFDSQFKNIANQIQSTINQIEKEQDRILCLNTR